MAEIFISAGLASVSLINSVCIHQSDTMFTFKISSTRIESEICLGGQIISVSVDVANFLSYN